MRAARLNGYHQAFRLEEVPVPSLQRPRDLLIRVAAAGLCRTDLHIVEGMLEPYGVRLPYTPGHETAGWVEEVGPDVTAFRPGDAVLVDPNDSCGLCPPCRRGVDTYCESLRMPGFTADGGFADYMVTSERGAVRLPPSLSPVDMAPHADAGLAAYRAVKKAARVLGAGDSVVVLGAGGLGHIAIQLLRHLTPASVIAVDVADGALALASELGADHAVPGGAAAVESVRERSGGGVQAVIDFVGDGDAPRQAIEMLRRGGTYFMVGYGGDLEVPVSTIVANELTIVGNLVGTHAELEELVGLAAAGKLTLRTRAYALEDINEAVEDLRGGRIVGRAVLVPRGD
jgi:NAD+-dependent secondary alcohol dehydrogenase Adh1